MKYTSIITDGTLELVAVKGCQTCPHKIMARHVSGKDAMKCTIKQKCGRWLLGNWEGTYHISCPLAAKAKPFTPEAE